MICSLHLYLSILFHSSFLLKYFSYKYQCSTIMEMFKSVTSTILSSSAFISWANYGLNVRQPASSFPRFSELPVELRLKIWELSLGPRLIPVDIYQRYSTSFEELDPLPKMHFTICTQSHLYKGNYLPHKFLRTLPRPAVFSACRESRYATFRLHSTYFDDEYKARDPIVPTSVQPTALNKPDGPLKTSALVDPTVDVILLRLNIGSGHHMRRLCDFVSIAGNELGTVRRVIVSISIFLPPYQWPAVLRLQKWRNWGIDGSWVPEDLVNFPNLREVMVLIETKNQAKMLSEEWRASRVSIWHERLEKMRQSWPVQWEENIPTLRFLTTIEDL